MFPVPCVLSLLVLLPLCSAQTYLWGPCPVPKTQPNFDIHQYLGKWYEIEKLPASFERGKCIEADYSMRSDGTIKVLNSQFYKAKRRVAEGTAVMGDHNEPGRLGVSFSYFTPYSPYYVLSTDYISAAVVYSCTDIMRVFHVHYAWILGRSRFIPLETLDFARQILMKEHIDITFLKATDQNGCGFP